MATGNSFQQLVNYFKKNLAKNYTSETLKWALVKQGYSRTEINRALEQANKEIAEKAPILKEKPKIKYEIIGEDNKPIKVKKPSFWRRFFN